MGFLPAAFDTFLILLREGLEAVLVLAALAAFLRRAVPCRAGPRPNA
jgi:high-affinity Fe2+/Pb2+ permease